jgi:hypothetical protein
MSIESWLMVSLIGFTSTFSTIVISVIVVLALSQAALFAHGRLSRERPARIARDPD